MKWTERLQVGRQDTAGGGACEGKWGSDKIEGWGEMIFAGWQRCFLYLIPPPSMRLAAAADSVRMMKKKKKKKKIDSIARDI
jgi:hypothetical protein